MEESLLFGGKLSGQHPIYKELAQLDEYSFIWWMLDQQDKLEWDRMSESEQVKQIIHVLGQIAFIQKTDVLTKLSAILGDSRRRVSMKGLKDELTARTNQSPEP